MVIFLDARQWLEALAEMCLPITDWDDRSPIALSNELSRVALSTTVHHRCQFLQRRHRVASECLLDETKTPVGSEFGVPRN